LPASAGWTRRFTNDAVEALNVTRPEHLEFVTQWIHDAHFSYEEASFSESASRATVPFAQESGWGDRHPSMPNPELLKSTLRSRHVRVPFVRCYLVFENALGMTIDEAGRGDPGMLNEATFDASRGEVYLLPVVGPRVMVSVSELAIRVIVSREVTVEVRRRVLRGWPAESDSRL
jgi:hypothetical protein